MSKIEWTGQTWNPIVGCSKISPGCANCYAEAMARRLVAMGNDKYKGAISETGRWTGVIWFDAPSAYIPTQRQKPTTYFVNSMSDLFHERVGINWLMRVWEVMRTTPQHTYQILTKRAGIMRERVQLMADIYGVLPNVWVGVSVEDDRRAGERIPDLCDTPAAVRFLSCEPLLEQISLYGFTNSGDDWLNKLHWVIVGGESGHGARPFEWRWAERIVRQCHDFKVPVFVKQMGANSDLPTSTRKGNDPAEWPASIRVREMPNANA